MTSTSLREKWDARYREGGNESPAARVLVENAHLLPTAGVALDLACGTGGNALFMASRGLDSHAWDISAVAIDRLRRRARDEGLSVHVMTRNVEAQPPAPDSFDVIVVSHFLARALAPALIAALKPRGLLFYQTFILEKAEEVGPSNLDFLLGENELLRLFAPLRVLVYREEGRVGDITQGFRNEAMLVARRREPRRNR
jgi:tellurite methyltransferase